MTHSLGYYRNGAWVPISPGSSEIGAFAQLSRGTLALNTAPNPIPWTAFSTTDPDIFKTGTTLHVINNASGDPVLWVYGKGWYFGILTAQWSTGTYDHELTLGSDTGGGVGADSTHGITPETGATSGLGLFSSSLWTLDTHAFYSDGSGNGGFGARFLTSDNTKSILQANLIVGYVPTADLVSVF